MPDEDASVTRKEFNELSAKVDNLSAKVDNLSAKVGEILENLLTREMKPPATQEESSSGTKRAHSTSSKDSTNSGQKRVKTKQSTGSVEWANASQCDVKTKMDILGIEDWTTLDKPGILCSSGKFGKILEVEKKLPDDLPGQIYEILKDNMSHRETRADMNEATRQSIVSNMLVKICVSVSKELGLDSNAIPKIKEEDSFSWLYAENKGIRGRFYLAVFKLLPNTDRDVYLIIEIKTTAEFLKGRDQLLIYLKRNLELGEDDEVYGIVSDLFDWKLICLSRTGLKISGDLPVFDKNDDWSDPLSKDRYIQNYLLFLKTVYTILKRKVSKLASQAKQTKVCEGSCSAATVSDGAAM